MFVPKNTDLPRYEELLEVDDITLWVDSETQKVFLQASDPYYDGEVTSEVAKEIIRALVGVEGLLSITDEQADTILKILE